mmetsp:Transcript_46149/g.136376  ORF Transcript_46149/g.136376 Transcript_46149/m.136376 type:complete len:479 (+) Transcript_46149:150-1586(+)
MVLGPLLSAARGFYGEVFTHLHPLFWVYVPYWTLIISALCLSPLTVLLPQYLKGELRNPFRKLEEPDVWIVHGKKYNLRPFMKIHPGGEFVLRAGRGSDITGLFESYHIFIDREVLLKTLDRYEIVEEGGKKEPLAVPADPFHEDLKLMVKEHFKGQPKGSHKMTSSHLALCGACYAMLLYLTYVMLTQDAKWTIPLIGFCGWYLTGNVMHDASHNAFVTNPRLNRAASYMGFPWCLNISSWHIQHVVSHHCHTNGEEDVDLYHFNPLIILQKGVGSVHEALHYLRLGFLCSTVYPHLSIVVPYGLLVGQVDPAHGHRMYDQFSASEAYRKNLRADIGLETLCLFLYFCLTGYMQGFAKGLCFYMSCMVVCSYLFSFFTQVSHLQEECFLDEKERAKLTFMKNQAATSMDFSADSAFWGHVSGGLNTQAIHHCLPPISAMHLRSMYPKFRQVCKKHGVELKEAKSLSAFVWGFIQVAN